jgi:hypothetical protein
VACDRCAVERELRYDAEQKVRDAMKASSVLTEQLAAANAATVAAEATVRSQAATIRALTEAIDPLMPTLVSFCHVDEPEYADNAIVIASGEWHINPGHVRRLRALLAPPAAEPDQQKG